MASAASPASASSSGRKRKPIPASRLCYVCKAARAVLQRPKTGKKICKSCFFQVFEDEIHHTIVTNKLFSKGDRIAVAASGGKDSTVLAHVMTLLNKRHNYGLELFLLSIDEGITGYRDDSLETVKRNKDEYQLPLKVVSYKDLYGWTMDAIVKEIGLRNNCTYCGVFRRQALDRGAAFLKATKMVTGHNADDVAETVLMNVLRGDIARLSRCVAITTGEGSALPRCKPFKFTYEKEIVMYAYFKKLDYFSTECIYSPNAYRGFAREFLKELEAVRPSAILDIIHSAEHFHVKAKTRMPVQRTCERCGYISSNRLCKACVMLQYLDRGEARLALGRQSTAMLDEEGGNNTEGSNSKPRAVDPTPPTQPKARPGLLPSASTTAAASTSVAPPQPPPPPVASGEGGVTVTHKVGPPRGTTSLDW